MNIPVVVTRTVLLLLLVSEATAEKCEFEIQNMVSPGDSTALTLTEDYGVRQILDRSQNFAYVQAARLEGPRFDGGQRYLRLLLLIAEFTDTEKQAYGLANSQDIPPNLPLEIKLTNGAAVTLESWGSNTKSRRSTVDRPNQNGNKSKKFRVNTWVGGQYWLDANLIATLSSHPAKSLLVTLQTGSHEVRFDPARADRIQFVLECT